MEYPQKEFLLKDGARCLIRKPVDADAEMLVDYMRITAGETRYVLREPEEVTMTAEQERDFLREKTDAERSLMLLAEVDGKHAGTASLDMAGTRSRVRHRCSVAITLYRAFWKRGIGTILLGEILNAAREAEFEQVELEVVSSNVAAIGLYKKMGFEVTGTMPRMLKYKDGSYADFLFMVKRL